MGMQNTILKLDSSTQAIWVIPVLSAKPRTTKIIDGLFVADGFPCCQEDTKSARLFKSEMMTLLSHMPGYTCQRE